MLIRLLLMAVIVSSLSADWDRYKRLFIENDGRIVDRGNNNITHTEGIGYTLYFSYMYGDDETFDKVYKWQKNNLPRNALGLIPWKWGEKEDGTYGILDKNNASDGDMWIAYSLYLMSKKRKNTLMLDEAKSIIKSMRENLIVKLSDRYFMLPGAKGFMQEGKIILNPSYYRFDIFKKFSTLDDLETWDKLIKDGEWMLHHSMFSSLRLHPDWIEVSNDLSMKLAKNKFFGYDAIRIPLNIMQSNIPTAKILLEPYSKYIKMMKYGNVPLGVVELDIGKIDLYNYCFGHLAIYQKILGENIFKAQIEKSIKEEEDNYYAYALYIFSIL